ncbi:MULTISPECIES: BREX-1 system adenine-specific DNA-methyltransferase PglX [unclassified Empedobacter]|uniref:BREX-1 system adenine-specific DNA-methyltransferase PglX n=1 Tax=unclassified Empedobacter TaxID=2643773 RepID=UPI0025BF34DE|nr:MULTISPECIES: BREX-1 system adenine-specific DNA-methyltransferase PglX [unclassified Empedobacter]
MKLSDHTNHIRQTVQSAVENRLGRLGIAINAAEVNLSAEQQKEKERLLEVFQSLKEETGTKEKAYEKLVDELTFTLFNRIAALKVLEAFTLIPETITQRPENGNRSFAHSAYLEQYPEKRSEDQEGLVDFIQYEFQNLAENLPLYSLSHYYHLLPTAIELKAIIDAFNAVEADEKDIDPEIWKSDDVLGWLYESYNNYKKVAHKDSKAKTEYDKVSIQSQVYTPKWVVKFLVDNSLGKQYLEMYPHSDIKNKYAIANATTERVRDIKPLHEIKLIDPAMGSGNFLLYAFDVFYDLYQDQIDNYGADYEERDIPKLILEHNLYGVDLDNRAAQIAQLGLYIKARRKKRNIKINHFNLVSSDFILPEYEKVKHIFNPNGELKKELESLVIDLWDDLRQAHKFGALIRIEEIVESRLAVFENRAVNLFTSDDHNSYLEFRQSFINDLYQAVSNYASTGAHNFMQVQATNAVTYLDVLTNKYDVAVANPPYTASDEYGEELKTYIEKNYKKYYENLYSCFIKRNIELVNETGYVSMITPQTFMFTSSFKDVRNIILQESNLDFLIQFGYGGVFSISVDPACFILNKASKNGKSICIKLDNTFSNDKVNVFNNLYSKICNGDFDDNLVSVVNQNEFKKIKDLPFVYWISNNFREKFSTFNLDKNLKVCQGLATGENERFLRFNWEIKEGDDKWVTYAKGGTFNKWYGNLWLKVNWENDGFEIKNFKNDKGKIKSRPQNEKYYFKEGITYSASGRGGYAFRYLPENSIFDVGGSSIFFENDFNDLYYALGILNSKLIHFIADCLNPTANIQVGDIKRFPFVINKDFQIQVSELAKICYDKEKLKQEFNIYDVNFKNLFDLEYNDLHTIYINYEENNIIKLFAEELLNQLALEIYNLSDNDRENYNYKFGQTFFLHPVSNDAIEYFKNILNNSQINILFNNDFVFNIEDNLSIISDEIIDKYLKSNATLEDYCSKNNINPIELLYKLHNYEYKINSLLLRYIKDSLVGRINLILQQDDDGIIPLYKNSIEGSIFDRLFTNLNNSKNDRELNEIFRFIDVAKFIEEELFIYLTDRVNLFSNLPSTPFIWHLSSGKYKAFEVYTSIYQWNRDSIFKLKSVYVAKRREQLQLRKSDLRDVESAAAQAEKELIFHQEIELDAFEAKLDELIAENYNPILDSGVAKNIAPLQKKGMIKADILKAPQLTKYLNADW